MIWLKEGPLFCGYVPVSSVTYENWEIADLNKNTPIVGWTTLPSLVMDIQGISRHPAPGNSSTVRAPQKLIDIDSSLHFDCFLFPKDPRKKVYYKQVYRVFRNLTFYRVKTFSEEEVRETMKSAMKIFESFITTEAVDAVEYAFSRFTYKADKNYKDLLNLFDIFHEMNLPFPIADLFAIPNEELLQSFKKERVLTYMPVK